jgi:uncharacterized protein (DUF2252 family)
MLLQHDATRIQELLPLRYGRMLARSSAGLTASDLSRLPISDTPVVACGDAHVKNFGVYASAERNLVFAINDYDEVHVAPCEWD